LRLVRSLESERNGVEVLRRNEATLRSQVNALQDENTSLLREKLRANSLEASVTSLQQELSLYKKASGESSSELNKAQQQLANLAVQLELQIKEVARSKASVIEAELRAKTAQGGFELLKGDLDASARREKELKLLLEDTEQRLRAEVLRTQADKQVVESDLNAHVKTLQDQLSEAMKKIVVLGSQKTEAAEVSSTLTKQLELARQQSQSLQLELRSLSQLKSTEESAASITLKELHAGLAKKDNELSDLRQQLESEVLKYTQMAESQRSTLAQLERLQQQHQLLHDDFASSTKREKELKTVAEEIEQRLRAEIHRAHAEKQAVESTLKLFQDQVNESSRTITILESQKVEALESVSAMTTQLELARQESLSLRQELSQLSQLKSSEESAISLVVSELRASVTEKDTELAEIKRRLEIEVLKNGEISEAQKVAQAKLDSATAEREVAVLRVQQLQQQIHSLEKAQADLINQHQHQLEELTRSVASQQKTAQEDIHALTDQLNACQRELEKTITKSQEQEHQIESLSKSNSSIEQERLSVANELESISRDWRVKVQESEKRIEDLVSERQKSIESIAALEGHLNSKSEQLLLSAGIIASLENSVHQLQSTIDTLQASLAHTKSEYATVEAAHRGSHVALSSHDQSELIALQVWTM
jgi:chromosome segregation ATPase